MLSHWDCMRPEPTGLFCTDLPLCDTDTDTGTVTKYTTKT